MSVLSNRFSAGHERAAEYRRAVLDLLGGRDPLEVLRETPGWLQEHIAPLSGRERATAEAPGKWSIAQVVQHLADSELVWSYRIRRGLAEDRPRIDAYDQDLWAERLGYAEADLARALRLFSDLREANLWLIERAGPEGLERTSVHDKAGEQSLRYWIRLYAGHDLAHRRQIERIRAVVGSGES